MFQIGLQTLHTVFMRHHNNVVGRLQRLDPNLDDETLYQEGRRIPGSKFFEVSVIFFLCVVVVSKSVDAKVSKITREELWAHFFRRKNRFPCNRRCVLDNCKNLTKLRAELIYWRCSRKWCVTEVMCMSVYRWSADRHCFLSGHVMVMISLLSGCDSPTLCCRWCAW